MKEIKNAIEGIEHSIERGVDYFTPDVMSLLALAKKYFKCAGNMPEKKEIDIACSDSIKVHSLGYNEAIDDCTFVLLNLR